MGSRPPISPSRDSLTAELRTTPLTRPFTAPHHPATGNLRRKTVSNMRYPTALPPPQKPHAHRTRRKTPRNFHSHTTSPLQLTNPTNTHGGASNSPFTIHHSPFTPPPLQTQSNPTPSPIQTFHTNPALQTQTKVSTEFRLLN
ncbi:hypothetical protein IAQ61_002819 [Plenodomus lingam]|uniref:uncharacterized protein n=1 Tax=Leptosphaeria maculans TaxID=5022 RepID=UPI00331C6EDF|nr:hypothetical protein IAQ61_002819 [Plenodomus lingam]